jgi:hypothetical protein
MPPLTTPIEIDLELFERLYTQFVPMKLTGNLPPPGGS